MEPILAGRSAAPSASLATALTLEYLTFGTAGPEERRATARFGRQLKSDPSPPDEDGEP